ncbi:MAG: PEP/pyruvate-binding domain-containing protein [Pseudomonadales bacterium]
MHEKFGRRHRILLTSLVLTAGFVDWSTSPAAAPTDSPPPETIVEARRIVARMAANPRGPYQRIRWFCNDGVVLPPQALACREHGGGHQHAQYSEERETLAALGFRVGTIFTALSWDEFFDADARQQRMRELSLERYLTDIDDGWVLRRAVDYRGRTQAQDEEYAGRSLLLQLLADPAWLTDHFLLARETVRVVPHGADGEATRDVRRAVQSLAEAHPSAEPLRNEIHNTPTVRSAAKVRRWADGQADESAAAAATAIAEALDALFSPQQRQARIEALLTRLRSGPRGREALTALDLGADAPVVTGTLLARVRDVISTTASTQVRLTLFDLLAEIESELLAAERARTRPANRAAAAERAMDLIRAAYGVGLVSPGELAAAAVAMPDPGAETWSFAHYREFVRLLQRVPQWGVGAVRHAFAEPLARYTALDPRAARFVDDTLRSSALFPLAGLIQTLAADLQQLSGVAVDLFGRAGSSVIGLNAGYASGPLRILGPGDDVASLGRDEIVVLPETAAELPPVAGILTLGEGSPLSHVQLLARNFGIPNVAIAENNVPLLTQFAGEQVLLAVGSDGSVALLEASRAAPLVGELLAQPDPRHATTRLRVPPPDLSVTRLLPIAELRRELSGRVVGPKAANLGELNRLFPGRVAPAIAIPFGLFARYTARGDGNIRSELELAYRDFRAGAIDEAELNSRLAAVRARIAQLEFQQADALRSLMRAQFGSDDVGVFVRSDTNVEDLPEFTGAGLSETVPNVVGLEAQVRAIPRVWASVLSPRAIAWRSNLLDNPADVYASVLLMLSVPSTKSGVLVTANLIAPGSPGLTVSTAWGVGGAVAGEAAATLVLTPDGSSQLVSEAKTPYQRQLAERGGIAWIPAPDGPVLAPDEQQQLRTLALEVAEKYAPALDADGQPRPWDIEFGFVDGRLTLFQIRPLVERGPARANQLVRRLLPDKPSEPRTVVATEAWPQ